MKNLFNKDYFENGVSTGVSLYSNYRWIPELTIPMAFHIIEELGITSIDSVLDYGCSKGYLVHAMRLLHRECFGVDVSEYAIGEADVKIKDFVRLIQDSKDLREIPWSFARDVFDYAISKDVFEHIQPTELEATLKELRVIVKKKMFVVVPLGDGEKYYEPAYEHDVTHVIRKDVGWWSEMFTRSGFVVETVRNRMTGIKENWKCPNGNGIFILK